MKHTLRIGTVCELSWGKCESKGSFFGERNKIYRRRPAPSGVISLQQRDVTSSRHVTSCDVMTRHVTLRAMSCVT